MKIHSTLNIVAFGLFLLTGVSMSAEAALFGGVSWKEEVLLHDGSKIVVERSQSYGGRHEITQTPPVREQEIVFTLPGRSETVTWKSEYSEDVGRANFNLLALHILDSTPYVVVAPNLCLSYNKWGRPNPPYVFFKYQNKTWRRIALAEFPAEFKDINLVVSTKAEENAITTQSIVSAESVRKINSSLEQPEYKTILREPIANPAGRCGEMVYDGKGGWIGIGWFRDQPTYEACLKYCEGKRMDAQYCPCGTLFKGKQ